MQLPATTAGPIDLAGVRDRVEAVLTDFLDSKAGTATALGHPQEITETLREFFASGGKRIRPLLCVVGWHAAGGHGDMGPVLRAAAALEMFVAWALVHDDLMDRSDTRRGRPAVHRTLASRHASRRDADRFGDNAALLIGNFGLIWSGELLHTSRLTPRQRLTVQQFYDTMLSEVMFGQYRDLLGTEHTDYDVDTALAVIRYKTATGTVQRPLQIGAAIAGATPTVLDTCTDIGLPLGEAFQLRDDLLGVFGSPQRTGKPNLDDLREGKRTVLLALAVQRATAAQRDILRSLVANPSLDEHGASRIRSVMEETGAREAVEKMISDRLTRALNVLDAAPFPPHATAALRQLAHSAATRTT
jgi:geranylgeranyl diphosphate synthase type I